MTDVQRIQLVKGTSETVNTLITLAVSGAVLYYSIYPSKAEDHIGWVMERVNALKDAFHEWQGMQSTLHDIWNLKETREPKLQ